ncbi:MAG: hypothetical protein V3U56_10580 [Syntrophobacteria bacterium]
MTSWQRAGELTLFAGETGEKGETRGRGSMPLEVGGALRLRLEARFSWQIAAGNGQQAWGMELSQLGN